MPIWSYAILGFVAIILAGSAVLRFRSRLIARGRAGENYETFRSAFISDVVSEEVILAVYKKFQNWESDAVRGFPVRASDDIGKIYGMVDDDLDDAVLDVLKQLNRNIPSPAETRNMKPVVTVKDFALFVESCAHGHGNAA